MKVLIIGANGKVGRRIARKMSDSSEFEPTAFIRKKEQKSYFDSMDVPVIVEDLENPQDQITKALEGFDAIVFSAGSGASTGYDKTIEIDLYGAVKTIHAAKENDIDRFVMVSAAKAGEPSSWPDSMRPYYIAKHLADKELERNGLEYTILRPVRLTDDDEAGNIKIKSEPTDLNKEVPREAVAEVILEVLRNGSTIGEKIEFSEGNEEIESAIRQFTD